MAVETRIIGPELIAEAVALLKQGECVAFPTETVYGLGANALDAEAVAKIFTAKGRPADNPLIVHIYSIDQIAGLIGDCHPAAKTLMERFWPGPLSLVLPKSGRVPGIVSAGLDTVAIRMPDHDLALEILRRADLPVAAPSANLSGSPSPTRAEHVWEDLKGRIPLIVDGGPTGWGVESTVLDCTCLPFRILRPGGVTVEQLRRFAEIAIDPSVFQNGVSERPRSPGMKYRHYAPRAEVVLVLGDRVPEKINQLACSPEYAGRKLGVLAVSEHLRAYPGLTVFDLGPKQEPKTAAARLYNLLRAVDQHGLDIVFVEGFTEKEIGLTLMNRLRKAAGDRVIQS
ncbi:MAG: threonylcarbamoyl-AMP synthase [Firmicutes bacterium]|nr:L-threonylcarbamoyladenylate synthase [Bacillota bacterium]NLL87929.1 threonylcarbamoyl-AMP synthase [Bacillota bacterium]